MTTSYGVNGLGQRVSKAGSGVQPSGAVVYTYDEAGHLIGEYDGVTGAAEQETVWLGDLPVAVLTGDLTSPAVYNVHPDHLSAPKVITDQIGNVVWNWNHDPFGNGQPTGTLSYNLRFPGQYYDVETGLNYNMNRDYDPVLGRYLQSDPIGLEGGINTYGYVGQNPLWAVDPLGLDATSWTNSGQRHAFKRGRPAWNGPTNGNWGGKCWSGGQYSCGGKLPGNASPLDSGDEAYQRHDQCYVKCEASAGCSASKNDGSVKQCKKSCYRTLVNELMSLSADSRHWAHPPRAGTESDSDSYRGLAIRLFSE